MMPYDREYTKRQLIHMHVHLETPIGKVPVYLKEGGNEVILLVFPSIFGLDEDITQLCDELFSHGFSAMGIDPFWSIQPGALSHELVDIEEAFMRMRSLPLEEALSDARIVSKAAKEFATSVVALGIGYGGRIAFNMLFEEHVHAASIWHGTGIGRYVDELQALDKPLELHYGELDPLVPNIEKEMIHELCKDKQNVRVVHYPHARHGFSLSLGSTFAPECYSSLVSCLKAQLNTFLDI